MKTYLSFKKIQPKPGNKMFRYLVYSEYYEHLPLGKIHWKGAWRTYVWQALPKTDIDPKCFDEIKNFIYKIMKEWREGKKK